MANRPALARSQSSKPCKLCNNLDPRSHPATYHDQESKSRSIAHLSLQLDPIRLKRSEESCPRCRLLAEALDHYFESWRKAKPRLLLVLVECAPVRLEVQDDAGSRQNLEIYAPAGKSSLLLCCEGHVFCLLRMKLSACGRNIAIEYIFSFQPFNFPAACCSSHPTLSSRSTYCLLNPPRQAITVAHTGQRTVCPEAFRLRRLL